VPRCPGGKDRLSKRAIAAEQMTVLQKYQAPRAKPLRLVDVREMFLQMTESFVDERR
jgi:hypothetical protein